MPLYELDGIRPQIPASGRFWIAPDAHVIGNGVLIGMGSTILNGATIGDGCLVGANALVTEGKAFEPGWMILGSPAKAARQIGPENQARMVRGAAGYVANWPRFKSTLKRID